MLNLSQILNNFVRFGQGLSPVENQGHMAITAENKNWLFNEIMPANRSVSGTFLPNKGIADIQASNEIRLTPGFATTLNPEFHIFIRQFARCNAGAPLANGSDDHQEISVLTNIQLEAGEMAVSLYPNPANDRITIDAQNKQLKEIRIFHADGRLISTVNPQTPTYQMDLKDLKDGMYFLQIIGESGSQTQKLIVNH